MSTWLRRMATLIVLLSASCQSATQSAAPNTVREPAMATPQTKAPAQDPAVLFERMEQALLAMPNLQLAAELKAEGALTAAVDAKLRVSQEASELTIKGTFSDQPVDTRLSATEDKLQVGQGRPVTRPAELQQALVLGLTRMGLMHNVARLTGSGLPDHADGGVRTWLETKEHALGPASEHEGKPAHAISFAIFVEGKRSAEATIWLDPETLRPLQRKTVVHFEQGDLHVVERYRFDG